MMRLFSNCLGQIAQPQTIEKIEPTYVRLCVPILDAVALCVQRKLTMIWGNSITSEDEISMLGTEAPR